MRIRGRQALAVAMTTDIGMAGVDGGSSVAVARPVRLGGHSLAPGDARVVSLVLPGRTDASDAIPVWAAVGRQPGPRVTVVAAVRGFEAIAARSAEALSERLDAETLSGSVAIVPVLRPGGRFAARGLPIGDGVAWQFPGDPGGNRRAREAFAIFSELVVGSGLLVVVSEPEPGRVAMPVVRTDLDDARLRRIAQAAGAAAIVHARPVAGSLAAAAREMGVATVEVMVGNRPEDVATGLAAAALRRQHGSVPLLRALLAHAGVTGPSSDAVPPLQASIAITETLLVRAPAGGLVEAETAPGRIVERGGVLARVAAPLSKRPLEIRSRHDVLVLETTRRGGVRGRGPLFLVGRVSRAVVARMARSSGERRRRPRDSESALLAAVAEPGVTSVVAPGSELLRIGCVEAVSLPSLGVERLRAKIDTGARTSALHVTSMKVVGTTDGPHRRPIVELTLPGRGRRAGARPTPVRVQVRDHVLVKDTSGHTERRPVIETVLQLGSIQRRIRVTLTNRGDMLFPMLIGRTALGPDVLVDPTRRSLLRLPRKKPRPAPDPAK